MYYILISVKINSKNKYEIQTNVETVMNQISLDPYNVPVGSIKQFHIALLDKSQKIPTLLQICKKLLIHHWIIFVRTNEKS